MEGCGREGCGVPAAGPDPPHRAVSHCGGRCPACWADFKSQLVTVGVWPPRRALRPTMDVSGLQTVKCGARVARARPVTQRACSGLSSVQVRTLVDVGISRALAASPPCAPLPGVHFTPEFGRHQLPVGGGLCSSQGVVGCGGGAG